jgi:hypothetical protein
MKQPVPMTLGNMLANGVRTLAAWCLGRAVFHGTKRRQLNYAIPAA